MGGTRTIASPVDRSAIWMADDLRGGAAGCASADGPPAPGSGTPLPGMAGVGGTMFGRIMPAIGIGICARGHTRRTSVSATLRGQSGGRALPQAKDVRSGCVTVHESHTPC